MPEEAMGMGDIIIGILASLGVVVLVAVFVYVVKTILLSSNNEE